MPTADASSGTKFLSDGLTPAPLFLDTDGTCKYECADSKFYFASTESNRCLHLKTKCSETQIFNSARMVCEEKFQPQTIFSTLKSINKCEGEFISKDLKLKNLHTTIEKASEISDECLTHLTTKGLFVVRTQIDPKASPSGDPQKLTSPVQGLRYIFAEELTNPNNSVLKSAVFNNLKDVTEKTALVNGWIDGQEVKVGCPTERFKFIMMVDACFPI